MGKFSVLSKQGREEISCTLSVFPLDRVNSFQGEELRVVCGTRGDPGTVAPFRAWRGSRDLVAQSPKFHAPALASISRECREKSSTASPAQPDCAAPASSISFVLIPCAARETRARIRILVLPPAHPAVALRTDSPNSL